MKDRLKGLREAIVKRLPKSAEEKAKQGSIANEDLELILVEAGKLYPSLPIWQKINHPRDNFFSIHIFPLFYPLQTGLTEPMRELQKQMAQDGVTGDQHNLHNQYEERCSHLWVAEVQRWTYRPIGICSFVREKRRGVSPEGTNSRNIAERWWLNLVWLNSAQRNHQVMRNSIAYFEQWHPDFVVSRDHPILNRSLKYYPEHLPDAAQSDTY